MTNGAKHPSFWGVVSVIVAADVLTKQIAVTTLSRVPLWLAGDWLALRLVYNRGAAFGIHVGDYSRWVFMGLAIVALVVLGSLVKRTPPEQRFRLMALGLVCGGALGNLIDRIRSAAGVVDFIDVWIGRFHWPTFNVADMAVTCGAIGLAIVLWYEGHHEELAAADQAGAAEA